jgi:phage baseplate assembly protein V
MPAADLSPDQNRRIESALRFGTVASVDPASATCTVTSGGITTDALPWLEANAGSHVQDWNPPIVGEQCVVLSPSGETGAGVVLKGLFQAAVPAPESSPDVTARHWADGAVCRYDQASHDYLLDVPDGGKITLKIGQTKLELTADHALLQIGSTTLELTAEKATLQAPAITAIAPPITMIGNLTLMGAMTGMPGAGGTPGGSATFHGRIDADEDVRVTNAGVSLKDHVHGGVLTGDAKTTKPVGDG